MPHSVCPFFLLNLLMLPNTVFKSSLFFFICWFTYVHVACVCVRIYWCIYFHSMHNYHLFTALCQSISFFITWFLDFHCECVYVWTHLSKSFLVVDDIQRFFTLLFSSLFFFFPILSKKKYLHFSIHTIAKILKIRLFNVYQIGVAYVRDYCIHSAFSSWYTCYWPMLLHFPWIIRTKTNCIERRILQNEN